MKKMIWIVMFVVMATLVWQPVRAMGEFFFMKNTDVGKEVENFTLKVVGGGEKSLSSVRGRSNTIVFFWATWCPHCRVALKQITENFSDYQKNKIKFVLVDVGETEQVVQSYLEKNSIDMEVFLDGDSEIAGLYGLAGLPTFYFVNKDGIVTDVKHSLPKKVEDLFKES